ncbi:MAG: hypothetical protein WDW36_004691 [Sanguina aurantia]
MLDTCIRLVAGHSTGWAAVHTLIGCWLLANVLYNHAMCVSTSPGSTLEVDAQALSVAMTWQWRWCKRCKRPKPPLSHHCSVCKKCVLKMDHHCVFMWNCVGHGNYKFFFLYMWYLTIASAYLCVMMFRFLPRLLQPDPDPAGQLSSAFLPFVVFITAGTVVVALCIGWSNATCFIADSYNLKTCIQEPSSARCATRGDKAYTSEAECCSKVFRTKEQISSGVGKSKCGAAPPK